MSTQTTSACLEAKGCSFIPVILIMVYLVWSKKNERTKVSTLYTTLAEIFLAITIPYFKFSFGW